MSLHQKILNSVTKPFKNLQTQVFKLTYKTDKIGLDANIRKTLYETNRKNFWSRYDRTVDKIGINFKLDGTFSHFSKLPIADINNQLWFEAVMFNWFSNPNFNDNKQYIILIADSDDHYEALYEKIISLTGPQCSVIAFNPPGIGNIPGNINNPTDYQNIIDAIIDYLASKGVKSRQITLLGHGFGAGIALTTAVPYHRDRQYIRVIADRGFSSSAKLAAIEAKENMHAYFKRPIFKKIFGTLAYYFTYAIVYICGLSINAAAAFSKLNQNYVRGIKVSGDIDIPEECSLDSGIDLKLRGAIKEFESIDINKHKADLQTLAPKNELLGQSNSALCIIKEWLDHFNKPSKKSSGSWSISEETKSKEHATIFYYPINYMYNQMKNVFGWRDENTEVVPINNKRRSEFKV